MYFIMYQKQKKLGSTRFFSFFWSFFCRFIHFLPFFYSFFQHNFFTFSLLLES